MNILLYKLDGKQKHHLHYSRSDSLPRSLLCLHPFLLLPKAIARARGVFLEGEGRMLVGAERGNDVHYCSSMRELEDVIAQLISDLGFNDLSLLPGLVSLLF